jgi:hypothetical protein
MQNDVEKNSPIDTPSDTTPLLLGKKTGYAGSIQEPEDEELVERKFLWLVKLSPSSTHVNFASFLFGVFITMIVLPFSSAILPFVLSTYLHIPAEEQGRTIGDLVFYNGIILLVFANLWGTISDFFGKKDHLCCKFHLHWDIHDPYTISKNILDARSIPCNHGNWMFWSNINALSMSC